MILFYLYFMNHNKTASFYINGLEFFINEIFASKITIDDEK